MVVESPRRVGDDVAALHRVGFVFADKERLLRRLTDEPRFAPEITMRLRALTRHEDLHVHPDRKAPRFDADDRAHAGHAVRPDGDDLPRLHQPLVDTLPRPMRRGVAFARRRAALAPQARADKVVLGEKALEIFVRCAYLAHGVISLRIE